MEESSPKSSRNKRGDSKLPLWLRVLYITLLFGAVIVIVGLTVMFSRGDTIASESKYVDAKKYQAVFLNNGQVYFGKVVDLNNEYVRMSGIYYLTQNTDSSGKTSGNYTLVKLGCQQIHDPTDQMLINRSQVTFWENLSDDGQVAKSIAEFKKQNPNGPDCSQVSNQTQASDTSGTQGSDATTNQTQKSTTGTNSTTNSNTKQ